MTARTAAQAAQDLQARSPMQIHLEALRLLHQAATARNLPEAWAARNRARAWIEAECFLRQGE